MWKEEAPPPEGKIRVRIINPLSLVTESECDSVQIPDWTGVRMILARHAPLFCLLKKGRVILNPESDCPVKYLISRGVCEIRRNICVILAWGIAENDIDLKQIQASLADAEKSLKNEMGSQTKKDLGGRIEFYKMVLDVYKKTGELKSPLSE